MERNTQALLVEFRTLVSTLRQRGVDFPTMEAVLLDSEDHRIVLEHDGMVSLPGFGARFKLNPMERTVYTLLVDHPEGLRAEDLWEHYDELVSIYGRMSWFDDSEALEDAVDNLCDDSRATFYSNLSRIKKKFTSALGATAASKYAVLRGKDNVYRIEAASEGLVEGSF